MILLEVENDNVTFSGDLSTVFWILVIILVILGIVYLAQRIR